VNEDPCGLWLDEPTDRYQRLVHQGARWHGRYWVAGELLRIAVDPDDGVPVCDELGLRQATVAAVAAEMLLAGQIGCDDQTAPDGRRVPAAITWTGTPVRDPAGLILTHAVEQAAGPRSVRHWMTHLYDEVFAAVADRFVATGMMRWETRADRRGRRRPVLVATYPNGGASRNAMYRLQRAVEATVRADTGRKIRTRPRPRPRSPAEQWWQAVEQPAEPGLTVEDAACGSLLVALGLSDYIRTESGARTKTRLARALPPRVGQMASPPLRSLLAHAAAAIRQTATRVR